jgi:hypothetical protein
VAVLAVMVVRRFWRNKSTSLEIGSYNESRLHLYSRYAQSKRHCTFYLARVILLGSEMGTEVYLATAPLPLQPVITNHARNFFFSAAAQLKPQIIVVF